MVSPMARTAPTRMSWLRVSVPSYRRVTVAWCRYDQRMAAAEANAPATAAASTGHS